MDLKFKNGSLHPARENNYWYCPLHGSINISMKNPCKYCLKKFLNDKDTTEEQKNEIDLLCFGIVKVDKHYCDVCDVYISCKRKASIESHDHCASMCLHNKTQKHMKRVKNDIN